MSLIREKINEALAEVRIIDPHCHLRPEKPAADNLADILLYHHVWIELVSSGMDQYEVTKAGLPVEVRDPQMPPMEQCRKVLPWLPNIQSTTLGYFLRTILADLYDVQELNESNLEQVYAAVEKKGADPLWQDELINRRCGMDALVSVEWKESRPYSPMVLRARENAPTMIVDGRNSSKAILTRWESEYGKEITSAADYRGFLQQFASTLPVDSLKLLACSVSPCSNSQFSSESHITRILTKARDGEELLPMEVGALCHFAIMEMLQALRETSMSTIQMFVGAEVLPPHRSITQWDGRCVGAIARIANAFPEFHFNLVSASEHFIQDQAILAKHIPNISVAGYWWHTMYPRRSGGNSTWNTCVGATDSTIGPVVDAKSGRSRPCRDIAPAISENP